jgi:hypothetical protein
MTTDHQTDRGDLHARGSNVPLAGITLGCLWVAGALGVLVYTFTSYNLDRPNVPSQELAIANAAMAAESPSL